MFWLNGDFLADDIAVFDAYGRGVLVGEGVFDTLRVVDGGVCDWAAHLHRLFSAAAFVGIAAPYSAKILFAAAADLLRQTPPFALAALRITVLSGDGGRGLTATSSAPPFWLMQLSDVPPPPLSLRLRSVAARRNEHCPLSAYKTTNCLPLLLARKAAVAAGDDEALLCNGGGRVACAAAANVFVEQDGLLLTPPLGEGVLPGITRAKLLHHAAVREQPIAAAALADCRAVYLSNSLYGVTAARALDGRELHPSPTLLRSLQVLAMTDGGGD